MSDLVRVLVLLTLVAGNAFFVIGEYAVVTARRSALAARANAGSAGARAALELMDQPVRVISTVQVGITAIGILTGAVGQPLVVDLLGGAIPEWLGFVIAFAVVTYLSVVLGELVPKALTLDRAETLAVAVARPTRILAIVANLSIDNYSRALASPFAQQAIINTLILVLATATIVMLLGSLIAWFSVRDRGLAVRILYILVPPLRPRRSLQS